MMTDIPTNKPPKAAPTNTLSAGSFKYVGLPAPLKNQLMTANSAVVSRVEEIDSAARSSLVSSAEQIGIMKKICDTADRSYELQVALSSKKMLEKDIQLLKSENASLANENKMLRTSMEHRLPRK